MAEIKLRPKQLSALQMILVQKQQMEGAMKKLEQEQQLLIELVMEEHGIEGKIDGLKLEEGVLKFEVSPIEPEMVVEDSK